MLITTHTTCLQFRTRRTPSNIYNILHRYRPYIYIHTYAIHIVSIYTYTHIYVHIIYTNLGHRIITCRNVVFPDLPGSWIPPQPNFQTHSHTHTHTTIFIFIFFVWTFSSGPTILAYVPLPRFWLHLCFPIWSAEYALTT